MPRTFRLDKLVRNGVLDSMIELGEAVESRVLDKSEEQGAYTDKAVEELLEFDKSGKPGELADALQAFLDKVAAAGFTLDEIVALQEEKLAKMGNFSNRVFVETVTLQDEDPWAAYYAAEPDRFTEITNHKEI